MLVKGMSSSFEHDLENSNGKRIQFQGPVLSSVVFLCILSIFVLEDSFYCSFLSFRVTSQPEEKRCGEHVSLLIIVLRNTEEADWVKAPWDEILVKLFQDVKKDHKRPTRL
jgi:chemotaxis protein CheY-P-specific phosphatase CheC